MMINEDDLIELLKSCYHEMTSEGYIVDVPLIALKSIAENLINFFQQRPMPDYITLEQSTQARNFFKDLIKDFHDKLEQQKEKMAVFNQKLSSLKEDVVGRLKLDEELVEYSKTNEIIPRLISIKELPYSASINFKRDTQLPYPEFKTVLTADIPIEKYKRYINAITWFICFLETFNHTSEQWLPSIERGHFIAIWKISLQLHSERYTREASAPSGPVHIIHFYESISDSGSSAPRASEYLDAYDSDDTETAEGISFDKTSHGLGAGVYGVGKMDEHLIDDCIERKSNFKIFQISTPLRLIDTELLQESDYLTEMSKYLQRVGNDLKASQLKARKDLEDKKPVFFAPIRSREQEIECYFSMAENNEKLADYAKQLKAFENIKTLGWSEERMLLLLKESMIEWFNDAKKPKETSMRTPKLVPMPINYVIKKLGFTGIISTRNDSFNRGLIAMEPHSSHSGVEQIAVKLSPVPSPIRKSSMSDDYELCLSFYK